jgi:methylated-DNA-protein-cysteine methyltransferase related protein
MPQKKKSSRTALRKTPNSKKTGRSGEAPGKTDKGPIPKSTKRKSARARFAEDLALPLRPVQPSGSRDLSFFELVYEVARQIPRGRVTSYGAIAACLGTRLSARVVGYAMNGADKINPTVPAHRVVNRVGLLSGKHHFSPPEKMEKLLKEEGIQVKDDTIVNFKEKFWDPGKSEDLGL